MTDLISIIMSTYNDGLYIKRAIDSVLKQTYKNWELIIINDASTDNTNKIIEEYLSKDKRIKYLRNKKNRGLVSNLTNGFNLSRGKYIARIDSDDVWKENKKLEMQYKFLINNNDYGLIGCLGNAVDSSGKFIFKINYPIKDGEIRRNILSKNCFIHSSILLKKNIYSKVGGYNLNLKYFEDYDLWLKIGTVSKFYNLSKRLVNLTVHQNSMTNIYQAKRIKTVFAIIKKYKNIYPNYNLGFFRWSLRKYYLSLLPTDMINKIKNIYDAKI
jgi:glycosyltransferase involved in cell wall biosynthesis